MNNLFKNSYLGKAYRTKDGRRVVIEALLPDTGVAYLISEDRINDKSFGHNIHVYRLDGISKDCPELDIVSEWEEPIDEEELDDYAERYASSVAECEQHGEYIDLKDIIKAVYRKAKGL